MSDTPTIAAATPPRQSVRTAIANAARATGIDFDYLLAQAKIESSLNPAARAPTSSAAGLYQFTQGTWLATLEKHAGKHGLGWVQDAISGGSVADSQMRAQIMALRGDPAVSSIMAAELASDNRDALSGQLGRDPDAAELYLAHFLGAGGARQVLGTLATAPDTSAAALLPQAAAANRAIFYDASGNPRSVAGLMDKLRDKVAGAMESGAAVWAEYDNAPIPSAQAPSEWQAAASFAQHRLGAPSMPNASAPVSMAQTLRDTFDLADARAPQAVRAAYERLRSVGL